jgi:hypothetical protein
MAPVVDGSRLPIREYRFISSQPRGGVRAQERWQTIMIVRRSVLIGVVIGIAFAAVGARAAEPSAKSFVEAIYAAYKGKHGNGISLDSDASVKRYFEPKLAALINKDRKDAAKRGDVSTLEGDPFVDAQDWQIDTVDIAVRESAADKAIATVSFMNIDKQTTVVLELVKLKEGWRIADITWDRSETLRGLFTKQ